LEVARIVCKEYGFTFVPGLVQLEKEIDLEIELEELKQQRRQQEERQLQIKNQHNLTLSFESKIPSLMINRENEDSDDEKTLRSVHTETGTDVVDTGVDPIIIMQDQGRTPSRLSDTMSLNSTGLSEISSGMESSSMNGSNYHPTPLLSQLDQKVMMIARTFYGKKAKHGIQRLEEGKYRIAGKIVFVRVSFIMYCSLFFISSTKSLILVCDNSI